MNLVSSSLLSAALAALSLQTLMTDGSATAPDAGRACCASGAAIAAPAAGKPDLGFVRDLAGTWVAVDGRGQPTEEVQSEYRVTAGGNAVLETLFPGTEKEMLSLYYMEGDTLMLTHFCVLGNHPTMAASREAGEIVFRCTDKGANFVDCKGAHHMHEGRYKRLDGERMESTWTPMEAGQLSTEPVRAVVARLN